MLDIVYNYANRWKLRFNASKCGVLVVGQRKSEVVGFKQRRNKEGRAM